MAKALRDLYFVSTILWSIKKYIHIMIVFLLLPIMQSVNSVEMIKFKRKSFRLKLNYAFIILLKLKCFKKIVGWSLLKLCYTILSTRYLNQIVVRWN